MPNHVSPWRGWAVDVCVLQVIDLLGEEDVKLTPDQLTGIMSIIHKEKRILAEDKQQKTEERKHQQSVDDRQQDSV